MKFNVEVVKGGKKKMKNKTETDIAVGLIKFGILVVVMLTLVFGSVYTISAGERGVLLTFGKPSMDSIGEGLHFKFPLAQSVKKMEVRTQKIETNAAAASKDLQNVETIIALNFHLSQGEVPSLYQEVGTSYVDRIINPAIQESVKAVQAKFTAEELISRRTEVRQGIQQVLTERLVKYYIVVDDFNIVNFQFSEEFNSAIEAKVTAEQQKLKAEMDLERIRVEKEQIITQAQAEAESLRLQKMEITPDLIKLRQIEVQRVAIEKWNGVLPQVTGGAMPFIDMRLGNQTN
jgi:regulator of protease activity HflC (stomatin/prohibitin superfamily)